MSATDKHVRVLTGDASFAYVNDNGHHVHVSPHTEVTVPSRYLAELVFAARVKLLDASDWQEKAYLPSSRVATKADRERARKAREHRAVNAN